MAERGEWQTRVVGVSLDGTGYGDDGSTWGGKIFIGSVKEGLERGARLGSASLPGGDAAAQYPVQAAAGFLTQLNDLPDITAAPFGFSDRYQKVVDLVHKDVRTFVTTSPGGCSMQRPRSLGLHVRSHLKARLQCGWSNSPATHLWWNPIRFHTSVTNWTFGRYFDPWLTTGFAGGILRRLRAPSSLAWVTACTLP